MPPEKVASMRKVFDLIDTSGDGLIQPSEIGAVLRRLNLVSSRKMIHTIIDIVDIDGDGEIDFPEYAPRNPTFKPESVLPDGRPTYVVCPALCQVCVPDDEGEARA